VRKPDTDRLEPFADARLTRVNLLAASDEADHDGPRIVAVEVGDE
jgi:hypothetical protein